MLHLGQTNKKSHIALIDSTIWLCMGAEDRTRTDDLRFTRASLYQLSYFGLNDKNTQKFVYKAMYLTAVLKSLQRNKTK